ncbi:MAG: nucleotidyltransferase domain-containing protein [Elusimicrobia bacterium]|nr:nucleotidyltransferase domain-containing protein [Elusimicrobiota bacterium]
MRSAVLAAIGRHLPLEGCAVFLFGSMAAGRGRRYSDYDVGLWAAGPISYGILSKIEEDIEDLPVDVELVDFSEVSRDFKRTSLQEVEVWNAPKSGLPWNLGF